MGKKARIREGFGKISISLEGGALHCPKFGGRKILKYLPGRKERKKKKENRFACLQRTG